MDALPFVTRVKSHFVKRCHTSNLFQSLAHREFRPTNLLSEQRTGDQMSGRTNKREFGAGLTEDSLAKDGPSSRRKLCFLSQMRTWDDNKAWTIWSKR